VEQREVGVSVFPGGEKVLIGDAGLGSVALLLKQPAQFQLSGSGRDVGEAVGLHVENLLEVLLGLSVTGSLLIRQASDEKNAGVGASVQGSSVQEVNGLGGIGLGGIRGPQSGDRVNQRDSYVHRHRIVRMGTLDFVRQGDCFLILA
jgi:hypothetical protein